MSEPESSSLPPPDPYRRRGQRGVSMPWAGRSPPARAEPEPLSSPPQSGRWTPAWPWRQETQPDRSAAPEIGRGFRRNTVLKGVAWVVGIFIAQAIVVGIALGGDTNFEGTTEFAILAVAQIVFDVVAFVVVPLALLGWGKPALRLLGLRRISWDTIGWAAIGVGGAFVILTIYAQLVNVIGLDELEPVSTIEDDEFYASVGLVALIAFLVVVVAPIAEEVFFRGFLFGGLIHRFGLWLPAIVSALLWAAIHVDVGSLIPFTLIGLLFVYLYLRTGSLTSAVLAHFVINVVGFATQLAEQGVG